eukprot:CAMPEP_0176034996 /NCGR_PEP_ID=MMETSP0120_2-20121206/17304_1 /TAXON_ID=160619 /ORGANISM="Kryptoperidinium foliaceum, Strain CCMP 1326" /LENGTH=306 /DNA_ID=CAMNT_0017368341 /DNA_START=127 /DNA_END=1044 /DNA_ORIENTATION=-
MTRFCLLAVLVLLLDAQTTFTTALRSPIPASSFGGILRVSEARGSQGKFLLSGRAIRVRGGSDEEEDDLDDEDEFFEDFEMGDEGDDDFEEESIIDRIIVDYQKTPPLTKGYLTASAIITLYGYLCHKNQFPEIFMLDWQKTLTRGQFWRPITTFFNFGPLGLGYLLTVHFVWTYMSTLERLHHHKPYEFWIMIIFGGMMSMVFGYPILKLNARFLGHNLSTFLVYMWSRYHEGMQVKMFEVHTTRAELLPWYFLLQTFLLEGEPPLLDFLGIVFGHIYHHFNTVGVLRAPESVVRWYKESESAKP